MQPIVFAAVLALIATPALALSLKSADVSTGKPFPTQFVCPKYQGSSVSPEFSWQGVPKQAQSLAITMFDPDAGSRGYWHWLLADIPPSTKSLAQGAASNGGTLPTAAQPPPNGAGHAYYDGPCPPPGKPHHYQITLYALPMAKLDAGAAGSTPAEMGAYLAKHAVATARLTPVYQTK